MKNATKTILRRTFVATATAMKGSLALLAVLLAGPSLLHSAEIQQGEMAGYLLVPNDKVPETFNAGFSLYVAAWPLLKEYPGNRFQTGLFGTWMFAQYEGKGPTRMALR